MKFSRLMLVVGGVAACRGAPSSRPTVDASPYLRAWADCALSAHRRFAERSTAVADAVKLLEAEPNDAHRDAARESWNLALDAWEELEPMRVGALSADPARGGGPVHQSIYAWTLFDRCKVDELLVTKGYEPIAPLLPDRRGLSTLEYLLFYEGSDNACGATHPINTMGSWAALDADDLRARKRSYARAVAVDVAALMQTALAAWEPSKGNFVAALTTAGRGSLVFKTQALAVNAVSDALFVIDTDTKDLKLAVPLAISGCTTATCPAAVESKYAHRSKQHIRNNLVGARKILIGCGPEYDGPGFDDYVVARGAGSLGKELGAEAKSSIDAVDAIASPVLEDALTKDPASVRRSYDAIKRLTDLLKTDFVNLLGLDLPQRVAGDAD